MHIPTRKVTVLIRKLLETKTTVRRGETVGLHDTERLHKSGKIIPMSVTVSPSKDRHGKITGASVIARDITRQKQAEWERQSALANDVSVG
jgi:PAS domain S-box-containing protein